VLVRDGKPDREALNANKISEADLLEELRLNGNITKAEEAELATIERSGEISVVPASKKSQ
jgi:uncharacterized membrane protein YcaP (DUF421 family)